jgi:uncharacterized protein YecT (DUF1311 family)
MRRAIVFIALVGSTLAAITCSAYSQERSANPTFNCKYARDSVRRILCSDREGAEADWTLTSAFWARYFSIAESKRKAFDQVQRKWFKALARECELKTDQTDFAPRDRECVLGAIHQRTTEILAQLQGDALDEAKLPPEAHADIQQGLTAFGFFNEADDGKFGPSTRSAIRRFLKSRHLPQSDFLSADQRVEIHRKSQTSISLDTLKLLRGKTKR